MERSLALPDLRAAVLCDRDISHGRLTQPAMTAQLMNGRRVFISHAHADKDRAEAITAALGAAGIATTRPDPVQTLSSDVVKQRLSDAIRSSDIVVVLISEAAARSKWTSWEVELAASHELKQRGVVVIPARLDATDVPGQLEHRDVVDLSKDFGSSLHTLIQHVKAATQIDFGQLTPGDFERLVADLLVALGFAVTLADPSAESGIDLKATRQVTDPFGVPETETWLVQCKLYGRDRISVEAIQRMAGMVTSAPAATRGLLVTNARITSVAQEHLTDLEHSGRARIRVLDGSELTTLLYQLPKVSDRHFGSSADRSNAPT
ncbi:TIR domain-containing protein [Modestobacter sp. SYSU DS0875]